MDNLISFNYVFLTLYQAMPYYCYLKRYILKEKLIVNSFH